MIKEIGVEDLEQALKLVNDVFAEFVAVDYSDEGKATFEEYLKIKYEETVEGITAGEKKLWGFYKDAVVVGVIATRDVSHISLLFVDKNSQKQGVAKQLFDVVLGVVKEDSECKEITVNSSPYAAAVYEHLGFIKIDEQQELNGIIFVPMKYLLQT